MPDDEPQTNVQAPSPSDEHLESVARESGASKDQVAQLGRAKQAGTDLDDAGAAAARWS